MATVLSLYNGALRLLKESRLSSTSDDIPSRYYLDDVIDGAKAHVLELGQWTFAKKTASISGTSTTTLGYAYRFAKPSDFVRLIAISSSSAYYPPLETYDEDATYWYSDVSTIYVSYVSDDASYGGDLTKWPETYAKVVEAYLAVEIAPSLSKSDSLTGHVEGVYDDALRKSLAKDAINRTVRVVSSATLDIYNDALRLVGKRFLTNFNDDFIARRTSDPGQQSSNGQQGRPASNGADDANMEMVLRRLLDESWDKAVAFMLKEGMWNFAQRTVALEYETDVEPSFGYSYLFEIPTDYVRLIAMSSSGELFPPLNDFLEENGFWAANCNPLYVQYVSNDASYGLDQGRWPETFNTALAHYLAVKIAPAARLSVAATNELKKDFALALKNCRTKDALDQAPMRTPPGRLTMARSGGRLINDQRRA